MVQLIKKQKKQVLVVKAEEKKIVLFEVSKAENHYIDFEITENCIAYTLNTHINYNL